MTQFKITDIRARGIIDGRGTPTVEVDIWVDNFLRGRADVPSGRSTGSHEVFEIRDREKRYAGLSVMKAIDNINKTIALEVVGKDVRNQRKLDKLMIEMDGTQNKTKLGANAMQFSVCL